MNIQTTLCCLGIIIMCVSLKCSVDSHAEYIAVLQTSVRTLQKIEEKRLAGTGAESPGNHHGFSQPMKFHEPPKDEPKIYKNEAGAIALGPLVFAKLSCGEEIELKPGDTIPNENIPCPCGRKNHWLFRVEPLEAIEYNFDGSQTRVTGYEFRMVDLRE